LIRAGAYAGPELVRDLMRELGLVACEPRPWRLTTVPDPPEPSPLSRSEPDAWDGNLGWHETSGRSGRPVGRGRWMYRALAVDPALC